MEYDQAETVKFTEKRSRWLLIGRWALSFFLFGFVCILSTYWFLKMPNLVFSGKNQVLLEEPMDKEDKTSPSTKESETTSKVDNDLLDMNGRLIELERNFAGEVLKLDILSSETLAALDNIRELQQLVASIKKEVRGLEIEREDTQIRQTILLLAESHLNRAHKCLELGDALARCLDQVKKAEELSDFLPDDLRITFLEPIKNYRIWLDGLYQRFLQGQTNDFNKLIVLVSELATAKNVADRERLELNQIDEGQQKNRLDGFFSSIFKALKGLVTVKKIDHQLLNQYPAGEANLIKLNFQLESATARIAFLTNDVEATQISISSLKNLSESYLEESTPLARLISKLEANKPVTPPIAREKLEELRVKIRGFRQSPGPLN